MNNEHPILFSGPMVRAILEGRKTQTRRVIQPQPDHFHTFQPGVLLPQIGDREISCPYGQPGDRLWVREAFAYAPGDVYVYRSDYIYDDDSPSTMTINMKTGETMPLKWRPSIHMPRTACRITLEIVSIRAERLQDISEEDARAEGVVWQRDFGNGPETREARPVFLDVWDAINGNRDEGAYTVRENPWVWVIEFKRINP